MKKEFQALKDLLFDSSTYDSEGMDNWDEVEKLLNTLGGKIDEVEKRIECAVRCANEVSKAIGYYRDDVDNGLLIKMEVGHMDSIILGSSDVVNALDLDDDMCVVDNWFDLFQPKKEVEPIAVGNVEYDFPEEVYSIGNLDNTEIIGDVYESVFSKLVEGRVIIHEMDSGFPKGGNAANWVISHNQFIPLIKFHQIDLSKVPIKREVYLTLESSWGQITCDRAGMVIEVDGDLEFNGEKNYLYDIVKFDVNEYEKFLNSLGWELEASHVDILSVGFWDKEGKYQEAEPTHRANYIVNPDKVADMVEEEVAEETHPIVNCVMCGHPQVVLDENIEIDETSKQPFVRCDECQATTDIEPKLLVGKMFMLDDCTHKECNGYIAEILQADVNENGEVILMLDIDNPEETKSKLWVNVSEGFLTGEPSNEVPYVPSEAPTMLCRTPQTHEFVKEIIAKLKVIDVDGETMEYILRQVGMEEQMLKQLFAQTTNDEVDYLLDVRNGKG